MGLDIWDELTYLGPSLCKHKLRWKRRAQIENISEGISCSLKATSLETTQKLIQILSKGDSYTLN